MGQLTYLKQLWLEPDFADRYDWLIGINFNPRLRLVDSLHRSITVCVDPDVSWSTEVTSNKDAIYWFKKIMVGQPIPSFFVKTLSHCLQDLFWQKDTLLLQAQLFQTFCRSIKITRLRLSWHSYWISCCITDLKYCNWRKCLSSSAEYKLSNN